MRQYSQAIVIYSNINTHPALLESFADVVKFLNVFLENKQTHAAFCKMHHSDFHPVIERLVRGIMHELGDGGIKIGFPAFIAHHGGNIFYDYDASVPLKLHVDLFL